MGRAVNPGTASPKIVALRPTVVGTYVSLRCSACAHEFESYQPTVAGIPVGEHSCPECSAGCVVSPEDFEVAVAGYLPGGGIEHMTELTRKATRIAETWHHPEALASLLTYRDVALGPATERELLASITLGLVAALKNGNT